MRRRCIISIPKVLVCRAIESVFDCTSTSPVTVTQVRLVETGGSSTGTWMALCFGANLLPGARLFASGFDRLTLVCATACLGYVFRVTFNKFEQAASSFFDSSVRPQVTQLNFRSTSSMAIAFGCEMCPSNQEDLLCAAIAEPGGKCWLVRPDYEPHEVTAVNGVVGRILTPVRNLWSKGSGYEVSALEVVWSDVNAEVGNTTHNEADIVWSLIATCNDNILRLWSGGQCYEAAARPNNLDSSLKMVGPSKQLHIDGPTVQCHTVDQK